MARQGMSYLKLKLGAGWAGLKKLREDEQGAAMIEYSILIGLITALVIALVVLVGDWVQNAWFDLQAQLT